MTQTKYITDDLAAMLKVFPEEIAEAVVRADHFDDLLEVVLDLGRIPTARFVDGEVKLLDRVVNHDDINHVVIRIGEFDADNRAGMESTLHRISAIRNRRGNVVGLTCRVGRAVYGTITIIEDLIDSGESILILGKPGVGKTTMLREAARILAEKETRGHRGYLQRNWWRWRYSSSSSGCCPAHASTQTLASARSHDRSG